MSITVLILKRSLSIPKAVWRLPATRRTLPPLHLEPLLKGCDLRVSGNGPAELIEWEVAADGSEIQTRAQRPLKENDSAGVFDLVFNGGKVKLRLSQEACRREMYTPRRPSQYLTVLDPGEPVRVILNGKADWPSGRYYYLQDYHVILFAGASQRQLLPVRNFDFQADLI